MPMENDARQGKGEPDAWAGIAAEEPRIRKELAKWMQQRRWFAGKARLILDAEVIRSAPLGQARVTLVQVNYADGGHEIYQVPLILLRGDVAEQVRRDSADAVIAETDDRRVLMDATVDATFREGLLRLIWDARDDVAEAGLKGVRCSAPEVPRDLPSKLLGLEQSNTSIIYDGRLFLKLYRRVEEGVNPDSEIIRFLSEKTSFRQVPGSLGAIEFRQQNAPPQILGLLTRCVLNEGDAWAATLREATRALQAIPVNQGDPDQWIGHDTIERVRLLARRTAEMHLALASDAKDPAFRPERFAESDREAMCNSMSNTVRRMTELVRGRIEAVSEQFRQQVASLAAMEPALLSRVSCVAEPFEATRIRVHGDYHLGQVLCSGGDFVILDFEGEPIRSLAERRRKACALRDVAGMIRSYHYAAHAARGALDSGHAMQALPWAETWARRIREVFFEEYQTVTVGASFIPADAAVTRRLLEAHLIEKAAYEVIYEMNHRPDWVILPVLGILSLLNS